MFKPLICDGLWASMLVDTDDPAFYAAIARHRSVLEQQPARYNLILGFLTRVPQMPVEEVRFWSFQTPGSCALQIGTSSIFLGALAPHNEAALVGLISGLSFRGIVGPDDSALRLAKRCENLGIVFEGSHAYSILELDRPARFPGAPGRARQVGGEDEAMFGAFMAAFLREAMPYEPVPTAERIATEAKSGRYLFWTVDDVPVSMAGKVRETATLAAISCVYTPPEHRARGYAASLTAALCERLFAEGKRVLCLHTELANPYSDHCYAKIGFRHVCPLIIYLRKQA